MRLSHGLGALPDAVPSCVTVGFFDGVHRGHQAVFARTVEAARAEGLRSVAVTFDRHPREVFAPGTEPPLITTLARKAELVAAQGIDLLLVLEFTAELAAWPPEDFARRALAEALGARRIVVGANFTFGHRAAGTLATLAELGGELGFAAEGVGLLEVEGRPVSSSAIRAAVAEGELAWPRSALGRPFAIEGIVGAGAGRGAGLGYPTANLQVPPRMLLPRAGIYAGRAAVGPAGDGAAPTGSTVRTAAVNVGTNPTFGHEPFHVEAHLLDFAGVLRGRSVVLELWQRLRDEERFGEVDDLVRQIAADVERTREVMAGATGEASVPTAASPGS